ncbi:hypothetical protein CHL76_02320 [Marinococcus halophilus]|uniref:MurNAc-LAA domain-containing protein n=1 Tax=Marinococcus halophilus TaxID=1371 RepID=A0A510Y1E5_MARHA|nr:N-acetylmuramoyl-L-alanine amidase [Marinococcus halophilus]OZT81211.1 hypothetical protein CHL76_02320 [Marinococcus halophilus]GEK57145.1 hypothetical protein MHA01_00500 [Marinococcus halophilus]
MTKRIAVGAGHGANTYGKRTPKFEDGSYMNEHDFNFPTAEYVREMLENEYEDVEVLQLGEEVRDVPLGDRTDKVNDWGADAYVSIHANALGNEWADPAPRGIETYVYESEPTGSVDLAENVHGEMIEKTGLYDRGVKAANFHVLRESHMSAILVECGFMDNREEAELLLSDDYRRTCAKAIVNGIAKKYGLQEKTKVESASTDESSCEEKDVETVKENVGDYRLESKVDDLRFYASPSWADAEQIGVVDEDRGFPTVKRKLKVEGGYQYEVENSNGDTFYITAAEKFVTLVEKDETPSYVGRRVESHYDGRVRFYNEPSWKDEDHVGSLTEGQGFPEIVEKVTVGNGKQFKAKNSNGDAYFVTANENFVQVV